MNQKHYTEDKENFLYSAFWDAYYNKQTGEWVEKQCGDPECTFCKNRPDKAF